MTLTILIMYHRRSLKEPVSIVRMKTKPKKMLIDSQEAEDSQNEGNNQVASTQYLQEGAVVVCLSLGDSDNISEPL